MNNSNTSLLVLLGIVGIGSYYIGAKEKEKKTLLKEHFDGFSLRAVQEKDMTIRQNGKNITSSVPVSMIASLSGANYPKTTLAPYSSSIAKYNGTNGGMVQSQNSIQLPQMLGSAAITTQPYISQPNYQQSVVQNRPDVQLSSWQRVAPPPRDLMGMAPTCETNKTVENFTVERFKQDGVDLGPEYPGPGFAEGNYNELTGYQSCDQDTNVQDVQQFATSGSEVPNVIVYDRLMTTTSGISTRTNRNAGDTDKFRGDLAIVPDPNTGSSFGYATANPVNLQLGALQHAMPTTSEQKTLKAFVKAYGNIPQDTNKPLPKIQAARGYQTIPQQIASYEMNKNGGGDTTMVSFS